MHPNKSIRSEVRCTVNKGKYEMKKDTKEKSETTKVDKMRSKSHQRNK